MTNDPETNTTRQPNSTPNTAGADDRDQQWIDTIDDWDAVLDGADEPNATQETATTDSGGTASSSRSSGTEASSRGSNTTETSASDSGPTEPSAQRQTNANSEFVRIDPISDTLLKTTAQVLPEAWLADTEVQQLIQWVVYAFVEETDPKMTTSARAQVATDRAAEQTSANAAMIRQLCTTSLYRGQSGAPTENFHSDLDDIQRQLAASSAGASD